MPQSGEYSDSIQLTSAWRWLWKCCWMLLGQHHELPPWSRLLVSALQLLVIGLIFRTWLGPFILRRVYKRMKIKSISPRSIRGLFLHTGSVIWCIDRIGLSYHRPSTGSARRFSVKIEGIYATILETRPSEDCNRKRNSRRSTSRLSVYNSSQAVTNHLWDIYSGIYQAADPYLRPIIRAFFVAFIRGIIRCLPALTQVLDFEVDRVVVSFTDIPGAHFTMRSATMYSKVVFTNVGGAISPPRHTHIFRGSTQYRFLGITHLKNRFSGSIRRVWNRAWGQTQGEASVMFTLRKVTLLNDSSLSDSAELSDVGSVKLEEGQPTQRDASARYDLIAHLRSGVCVELPDANEFETSLRFGPTKEIIMKQSISVALTVPAIQIKANSLLALLQVFATARTTSSHYGSVPDPFTSSKRQSADAPLPIEHEQVRE